MTQFLKLANGNYINADCVAEIRATNKKRKEFVAVGKNGDAWNLNCGFDDNSIGRSSGTIIPAQPGFNIVEALDCGEGIGFTLYPIVAWRIEDGCEFFPLCADDHASGSAEAAIRRSANDCAVLSPDGRVIAQGNCEYDTLEDFKEAVMKKLRDDAARDAAE